MIGIVYFFQQLFGERQYLVEGMQFMRSGDAARDLAEVVEFDFQRQCIAGKAVALETFHQFGGHMVKFNDGRRRDGNIFFQCMFTPTDFGCVQLLRGAGLFPGQSRNKVVRLYRIGVSAFQGYRSVIPCRYVCRWNASFGR